MSSLRAYGWIEIKIHLIKQPWCLPFMIRQIDISIEYENQKTLNVKYLIACRNVHEEEIFVMGDNRFFSF